MSGPNGSPLGNYLTEMLQLDASGLPGGAIIRESPILASLGVTSIAAAGPYFAIESSFGVNTELSLDGGQIWIAQLNGPSTVSIQCAPEPASLALCALGIVATSGLVRRRCNVRA